MAINTPEPCFSLIHDQFKWIWRIADMSLFEKNECSNLFMLFGGVLLADYSLTFLERTTDWNTATANIAQTHESRFGYTRHSHSAAPVLFLP